MKYFWSSYRKPTIFLDGLKYILIGIYVLIFATINIIHSSLELQSSQSERAVCYFC